MRRGESRAEKNENGFFNMISGVYAQVFHGEDMRTEEDKIIDTIKSAHEEWRNAEAFFQNVTDPDLVDYAIYRVEAAKTRYIYLMRVARELGIKASMQ
ncbi:YaaL family protein [Inediibacterium massiliense]|uniref:YaaL family protein n=1 Tax=Inediibacterium massiliense TaxID=1658111 RepID=UPI0006B4EDD9|nr:YaaL family protein [Inediibacterium massiliense]